MRFLHGLQYTTGSVISGRRGVLFSLTGSTDKADTDLMKKETRQKTASCVLAFALCAAGFTGCSSAPKEILHSGVPSLLDGVIPEMNSPGFWIAAHPDPDTPILDAAGIARLNERTREAALIHDLSVPIHLTDTELIKDFRGTIDWISNARIFQANGKRVSQAFMQPIVERMNLDSILPFPESVYGFIAVRTDCRVLPTNEGLFDEPGDLYIDNLQASSLEPGVAAVALHASADGQWLFVRTRLITGWIPAVSFARTDRDTFLERSHSENRLTVIAGRADIWNDEGRRIYAGYLRMGSSLYTLPGTGETDGYRRAAISGRSADGLYTEKTVWIRASEVTEGYLPYTARTVYTQAFRLLHTPYGWGGLFGERDCSQFLCEVFATVGIILPRNSSRQARTGIPLEGFTKDTDTATKKALLEANALPGATLLRLPGHIMLYLGTFGGEPIVIHSTWAYRQMRGTKEIIRLVNRTVVSGLNAGSGTEKGSHLERLTTAALLVGE